MSLAVVTFHRLAAQEFRKARSWYGRRRRAAAVRFIQALDRALQQVAEAPESWPLYDERHRWVKIKKFPYLLIYRVVAEGRVTIVAVADARRRPGYWRKRSV
jgi:plasmid stabilization system protein ParE